MNDLFDFLFRHWMVTALLGSTAIVFLFQEWVLWKNHRLGVCAQQLIDKQSHQNAQVVDLREAALFEEGHIVGAVSMPRATLEALQQRFANKDSAIILVCSRGLESAVLLKKLQSVGYTNIAFLVEGMAAWRLEQLPVIKGRG